MDAIHSWIDEEEVTRLAEKLSTTPERMKDWKKLDSDGFAIPEKQGEHESAEEILAEEQPTPLSEKTLVQQRSLLAGASQMAKSAGLIHSEKDPVILEDIKKQSTEEVLEQIEAKEVERPINNKSISANPSEKGTFVIVQELFSNELNDAGLCIIDRDGDVLYDSFQNLGLTHFTVNVMKTSSLMQINDEEVGSLRIKHSAFEIIEFLSVKSSRGVVLVAARLRKGLGVEQRQKIAQDLRQILNG